jgi:hypothetical protein
MRLIATTSMASWSTSPTTASSARVVLEELQKWFPRAQRFVSEALEKLK